MLWVSCSSFPQLHQIAQRRAVSGAPISYPHPALTLVKNPVQKYSVVFMNDDATGKQRDYYDYGLVQYAIGALRNPFDEWDAEWTKRRESHAYFSHVGRNEACPCESGKKYKKCCLQHEGVLRPHVVFRFAVLPPEGTSARGFVE